MKKFFALILTIVLTCSIALADYSCAVNPAVRMIAFQMGAMDLDMETEELEALAALATGTGTECTCSETKLAILRVLIRNMTVLEINLGEVKLEMMLEYIAHCGCCGMETEIVAPTPTPVPVNPTHTHHGGTHANHGKCTGCGVIYQKHETVWKCDNNSTHTEYCSCGWTGATESHKGDGVISIERDENGRNVGKYYCTVCGSYFYWYVSVKESGCFCECCYGNCCENCSCGCACK